MLAAYRTLTYRLSSFSLIRFPRQFSRGCGDSDHRIIVTAPRLSPTSSAGHRCVELTGSSQPRLSLSAPLTLEQLPLTSASAQAHSGEVQTVAFC